MIARHAPCRRGVALLVALIVVMSVSTLAVGLLQRSLNGTTESEFLLRSTRARLLADDLTPMLLEWAAAETDNVFRDADAPESWVSVFESNAGEVSIQVHAIDCSGRLHTDRLDTFARLGLPSQLQRLRHASVRAPGFKDAPNLQPLLETYASELTNQQPIAIFPDLFDQATQADQPVLTRWITTHGDGALNVNTAPVPLLQAALRGLDPSTAREILALRKAGEAVPASLIQTRSGDTNDSSKQLRLTTTSSAVGFIVTVSDRSSRHRWWIVAERLAGSQPQGPLGAAYGANANTIGAWRITERRRINQ